MSSSHSTALTAPQRLIILWMVFQLGTVFHTQLGLIPLFHGLDVLAAHGHVASDLSEITSVLWLMLAFFLVPLLAILTLCFSESRRVRIGHFWLTAVYTVLNVAHLGVDLTIPPIAWYQIVLMLFLVIVGLLLNLVSYQWMRAAQPQRHRLQSDY